MRSLKIFVVITSQLMSAFSCYPIGITRVLTPRLGTTALHSCMSCVESSFLHLFSVSLTPPRPQVNEVRQKERYGSPPTGSLRGPREVCGGPGEERHVHHAVGGGGEGRGLLPLQHHQPP